MRLSLADADLGKDNKDESNSIESQRLLIRSFLEKKPEFDGTVFEYVDDGYSGTNFDRPAFKQMMEDAKKGVIQVIVVKDLSRFGRDYIGVGDYLEQVLPSLGIRVIAINSNYDSVNFEGKTLDLDTSISNLVNAMYCRDLSKKITSTLKAKWKEGINTSPFAPYGYIKQKDRTWIIDPEAGEVVKTIFELASSGKNVRYIVDYLNERKILTPAEYLSSKPEIRANTYPVKCKEPLWDKSKVHRIIKNSTYTGIMEHGQRKVLRVGRRNGKKTAHNERFIIENDHPAIVSREVFDKAQSAINSLKETIRTPQNNPLTGKVFCANCGLRMLYNYSTTSLHGKIYCPHGMNSGTYTNCSKEGIDASYLEGAVLRCLCLQVGAILALRKQIEAAHENEGAAYSQNRKTLQQKIDALNAERMRLYEKYANGHMQREKYLNTKEHLNAEKDELQARLDEMVGTREKEDNFLFEAERIINRCGDLEKRTILTRSIADTYLESVTVHDKDRIDIEFKFEDVIKELLEKQSSS